MLLLLSKGFADCAISNYSKHVEPLTRLTKRGIAFVWTDEHDTAFQATLAHFYTFPRNDSNSVFVLDTDASDTAIGA